MPLQSSSPKEWCQFKSSRVITSGNLLMSLIRRIKCQVANVLFRLCYQPCMSHLKKQLQSATSNTSHHIFVRNVFFVIFLRISDTIEQTYSILTYSPPLFYVQPGNYFKLVITIYCYNTCLSMFFNKIELLLWSSLSLSIDGLASKFYVICVKKKPRLLKTRLVVTGVYIQINLILQSYYLEGLVRLLKVQFHST